MNIAQRIKSYYESKDFKNNYSINLLEDIHAVKNNIKKVLQDYKFDKFYGFELSYGQITDDLIQKVYDHILDNIDDFTRDFNGYWVGSTSLDSVSFGEQEEEIQSLINHKTGEPYGKQYLKIVFEDEDFYISDNGYAYYDMSSEGVHVDLLAQEIPFLRELKQLETT